MKKTLTLMTLAVTALLAFGSATFTKVVKDTYKFKPTAAAAKAGCLLCHTVKMPKKGEVTSNVYGKDLAAALGNSKVLTAAHLKAVEGKDSDKDGARNGDELRAGTLPGDAKSK